MLQLRHCAHLSVEARQQTVVVLVRQQTEHFDSHESAQADVLGLEDDAHAADADAIQHPIVAQEEAEALPRTNAGRLIGGQQAAFDESAEQLVRIRAALQRRTSVRRQGGPVLGREKGTGKKVVQKVRARVAHLERSFRRCRILQTVRGTGSSGVVNELRTALHFVVEEARSI